MLEGLKEIDWSLLTHAFGPADDVPAFLRTLAADDAAARDGALEALYANICHQGTRYPATARAMPFLVEIIEAARPRDTQKVLMLAANCVAGFFSPVSGPFNGSGPAWKPAPASEQQALLLQIEHAAAAGIPAALKILECDHARSRASAAYFLACFRTCEPKQKISERLGQQLSRESNLSARATIVFALGEVLPLGSDGPLLEIFRTDKGPLVRLIAAMMLARRTHAPAEVEDALCQALEPRARLDAEYQKLPWQPEGLVGDVAATVAALGAQAAGRVLPLLQARLAKVNTFDAVNLLEAALAAALGGEQAPKEGSGLTAPQRELLSTLARNTAFWTIGNALNALGGRGLPSMREELAAYLGVTVQRDPVEEAKAGARMYEGFGPKKALQEWKKVLEIAPDDVEALTAVGAQLAELEQPDKALPLLEKATKLEPANGVAQFHYAYVLAHMGENPQALAAFERAEELVDDPRPARQNRIALLQRLGRAAEAAALDAEDDPDAADDPAQAWYERGLTAVKAGKYDESIAAVEKAVDQRADHASSYYTLACAFCLRNGPGDTERALENAARAIKFDPEVADDIAADSDFARIKDDPRFRQLVGNE